MDYTIPFERYPSGGRQLLGKRPGGNCRHGYGLRLQRMTGQTYCSYCEVSLVDSYEHWLSMTVDHVVPTKCGTNCGIPQEWLTDFSNTVLCCGACNSFRNRYPSDKLPCPTTLAQFYELRDRLFLERRSIILASHEGERVFFKSKPWNVA